MAPMATSRTVYTGEHDTLLVVLELEREDHVHVLALDVADELVVARVRDADGADRSHVHLTTARERRCYTCASANAS